MRVRPDSTGLNAASVALFILSSSALAQECLGPSDIALVNGNILMMDADGSVERREMDRHDTSAERHGAGGADGCLPARR